MALVVAYGNPNRGDDAVGWRIAQRIGATRRDIETITRPRLVPELADEIALASVVVFVDARPGGNPGDISWRRLVADETPGRPGHGETPAHLLALASGLSGRAPDAFLVTVAGERFEPGQALSPAVAAAVDDATSRITALLASRSRRS